MSRDKKRQPSGESRRCAVPECGRPEYARGLCQTHHRQMLTLGRVKPIRPYRKRSEGTIKFGGLRLTPDCAAKIQRKADREGSSVAAAMADILEQWRAKPSQAPVGRPRESGSARK